jgi:hypothetical protein
MRSLTRFFVIVAVVLFAVSTLTLAGDEKWFDMENCAFCQTLMDPPDMLQNITHEHHNISNGIITVTTVDMKYLKPFRAAVAKMEALGKEMEEGKQVPMCNACMAMGKLMMMGAKWESVTTTHGTVDLMTSDDPKMIKEIQAWGKKSMDEMAKMEKMEHEHGHEH